MLSRKSRRLAFVALVLCLLAVVSLWPDKPSQDENTSRHASVSATQQATDATPGRADTRVPASVIPDSGGSTNASQVVTSATETSRRTNGAPVRLQVLAPSDVQLGEVFQVRIDVEANGGVRELLFAVSYEKSRLALVGWSEGTFAKQGGLPTELGVEEPSDGNIQITFKAGNGLSAAGAGSVAVFQFEAVKAGTSRITFQNLIAIDSTGATDLNVAILQEGSVTIH